MKLLRPVVRAASYSALGIYGLSIVALGVDAPHADLGDGTYEAATKDRQQVFPTWLHNIGRFPIIATATAASKFYFKYLNSVEINGLEHLVKALEERPRGTPVITVCNHTATLDDPCLVSCMMPWKYMLPWNTRWGLCSQEYSYTRGIIASTFFYAGKTLPVKRGAGIDHKMLENYYQRMEEGEWVHIFPEGKIDQHAVLGGRTGALRDRIGRLKWGVGKLIARAKERPIVVPFYHTNMQKIMPQNELNQVISFIPKTNVDLRVHVGKPICFDDLFEEYATDRVIPTDAAVPWQTQAREHALYSAITRRIENALLDLAKQAQVDQ